MAVPADFQAALDSTDNPPAKLYHIEATVAGVTVVGDVVTKADLRDTLVAVMSKVAFQTLTVTVR